jgi:hypothetical protein
MNTQAARFLRTFLTPLSLASKVDQQLMIASLFSFPYRDVKEVCLSRLVKARVKQYLAQLESCPMQLPPPSSRATPIEFEAISNVDMQVNVFDLVNFVSLRINYYTAR